MAIHTNLLLMFLCYCIMKYRSIFKNLMLQALGIIRKDSNKGHQVIQVTYGQ
jgi:hypothetical protein